MTNAFDFADYNVARKDTLAVLNNVALTLPEAKSIRTNGTVNDIGIPKPTAAPTAAAGAAGNPNGVYLMKVTFKDSVTGFFGEGSDTFSVTVTNQRITVDLTPITNENQHSAVDTIQLWRTLAGGTILFLVAEFAKATTSYSDNASDASISVNDTLPVAEQAYKGLSSDTFGFIVRAKNYLMAMGSRNFYENHTTRNQAKWTAIEPNTGIPFTEAFPDENLATFENGGEHLRSACMMGDIFVVMEEREIWNWVWLTNPDEQVGNGRLACMGVGRGTTAFKTLIDVDGELWSMDAQGFFYYAGGQSIIDVTEPVVRDFNRINWNQRAQFHGAYDNKRIVWFVALDADTECRHAFVLDRKSIQGKKGIKWWVYKIRQGARDSCTDVIGPSATAEDFGMSGKKVIRIITSAGFEEILMEGIYQDGVHPDLTSEGDIDAGATQTFTVAAGLFEDGSLSVAGAMVQFDSPLAPEPVLITATTATTFTVETAFGTALPAGTPFRIGVISGFWRSGQLDAGGPETVKNYDGIGVVVNPMPFEGSIQVITRHGRIGEFASGVNQTNRTGHALTKYRQGTELKTGGRLLGTGNRTGYQSIPVHGREGRYIEVEFKDESLLPWELVGYYVQSTPHVKK